MQTEARLLQVIDDAMYLYHHRNNYSPPALRDAVRNLSVWGLFSANHLAQLSGLSVSTVYRLVDTANLAPGGKFNPMSLGYMRMLLIMQSGGETINMKVVKYLLEDGNSYRIIQRFTTLPLSAMRRGVANA